ncbi:MAG: tRNA (adenosine(37)-N6)-threonylcarbamoyltransferase complex dimerization subunit type 1 TsaB, partial [Gemmatimonadales bacterium]
MMVLAVDAATDRLSVAAGHPRGRQAVRELSGARRHAGALPQLVLDALAELGARLADVEALAVSDGPGSFTGLRVASSWAKGVWQVRSLPFWVASTLLVRAARQGVPGAQIVGVGSALRGEVYAAGYRFAD